MMCACGELKRNHSDTENTEMAQRRIQIRPRPSNGAMAVPHKSHLAVQQVFSGS